MIDALLDADRALFLAINARHIGVLDVFFGVITWFGTTWVSGAFLLIGICLAIPARQRIRVICCCAAAMILSGLLNHEIKSLVHRPRPVNYFSVQHTASPRTVHVVGDTLRYRSFPSGHANTAFGVAAIATHLFGGLGIYAFIPAVLTAYSRVYMGVHFPLDTLAGGALGALTTWAVMAWCDRRRGRNRTVEQESGKDR
jgi:undecaprenyl-diphosphatase